MRLEISFEKTSGAFCNIICGNLFVSCCGWRRKLRWSYSNILILTRIFINLLYYRKDIHVITDRHDLFYIFSSYSVCLISHIFVLNNIWLYVSSVWPLLYSVHQWLTCFEHSRSALFYSDDKRAALYCIQSFPRGLSNASRSYLCSFQWRK